MSNCINESTTKETTVNIKSGFEIINWNDRLPLDIVSLSFDDEYLKKLQIHRPESKEGGSDSTHSTISLLVENIGDGLYHVSISDYFIGRQVDLGEGTYEVEIEEAIMRGWSPLEKILTDMRHRIDAGEIDLTSELKAYYDAFAKDGHGNKSLPTHQPARVDAKGPEKFGSRKSKTLETEFRNYLANEAISQTTGRHYSPNTVSEYVSALNGICREEGLSLQELFDNAGGICDEYEVDGCKGHLGERGHNTYRNALRRFAEFAAKKAGA